MSGYTKLFSSIVTSTVWREPDHVRLVWITMLALSDRFGVVEASIPGLADMARVSMKDCQAALKILSEPDQFSRSKECEGRRIHDTDGGWQLINHGKYRSKLSADERRVYNAFKQQESRARKKAASMTVNDESAKSSESAHTEADTKAQATTDTKAEKKIKPLVQRTHVGAVEPAEFSEFWNVYPNHKGRAVALRSWLKLKPSPEVVAQLHGAVTWQREQPSWKKERGQFVPMLATWLNQRRWEDEPFNDEHRYTDPNRDVWDKLKAKVSNGNR